MSMGNCSARQLYTMLSWLLKGFCGGASPFMCHSQPLRLCS